MGLLTLNRKLKGDNNFRVLLLGLDGAGKTSILKRLSQEDMSEVKPTEGYNTRGVPQNNGTNLILWDIGGGKSSRNHHWETYFDNSSAVIFVIDSTDKARLEEACVTLRQLLVEEKLAGMPFLIFANKQDVDNAESSYEIQSLLELDSVRQMWKIIPCSAKTGDGVQDGMEWLAEKLFDQREWLLKPRSKI